MREHSTTNILSEIEELRNRLEEAEQLIDAIKAGEVDAFALNKNNKPEIFTLESGDYAYRILVENFSEGALNISEDGLIVYTNTYFYELVNLPYEKVICTSVFDFIHPDSKETFRELFRKGLAGQSKGEIKLAIGKQIIPVYVSLTSLYPRLQTVGMIVTDLTEKREKERIIASEKRLTLQLTLMQQLQKISTQLIYQNNTKGFYEQLLDAAMVLMNSDFASIQRYNPSKDELLLLAHRNFHPQSAEFWNSVSSQSQCSCGQVINSRERIIIPDIEASDVYANSDDLEYSRLSGIRAVQSTPLISRDGKFLGMISTHWKKVYHPTENDFQLFDILARQAADLIERKEQENRLEEKVKERTTQLQKSEEKYHRMVEEVQDYIIILLSKDGIIENWNKGAEKIKGYTAEEAIGKSFSMFYTEEDRRNNLPEKLLAQARQTGKATDENWRVRKDGSRLWGSIVITALHDDNNEVIGFVKVTRDLTEIKIAEENIKAKAEQLEAKNIELEKMNMELQSFAYVSSHDLQEPLRKIQTFSTRILEKEFENLSDNGKDNFTRMQFAAKRMQKLIEDLLAYSRTNTTERKFETTNLNKIIEEVKRDLKEDIKAKHATIEVAGLCDVSIIPFQFRQLMNNLIGNSLKFSNNGQPPHIKIKSKIDKGIQFNNSKLSPQNKYCHISVSDNGIGFESQYSEKIFEVFQRLHGKTEYNGTGIGLAIVKKIVENHKGIITAKSELDKGARFDIYLPVV